MSRTPIFRSLQRAIRKAFESLHAESSNSEARLENHRLSVDRRKFLQLSAASLTPFALPRIAQAADALAKKRSDVRIAIIGAGIAGLSCAYKLHRNGINATIYEGNTRIGGRMFTVRGKFPNHQTAELGGEFIDTDHVKIRALAHELGLPLDDLRSGSEARLAAELFYINGRPLTEDDLVNGFRPLAAEMAKAVKRSDNDDAYFAQLDAMGILEWIDSTGAANADMRSLLGSAFTEEYGLDADEQSVFNLLYLIDYTRVRPFRIYGGSDERYHIRGGNDLLPRVLAHKVRHQIETSSLLTSVRKGANGNFLVGIERDSGFREIPYHIVVFALPFTLLRQVNLDLPLPPLKRKIINELGYGTNAKIIAAFQSRIWHASGNSGYTISDNGLQSCWDSTRKQSGATGVLTFYLGGAAGLAVGNGTPEDQVTNYLPKLEQFFPGAGANYIPNSAIRMFWPTSPFVLGSYACYKRSQAAFSGHEGKPVGNLYFCGEHCSIDSQGYMEGGCETGLSTAAAILRKIFLQRVG